MDEKRPVGRPRKEQPAPVEAFEPSPNATPNLSPHEGTPELNPRNRVLAELAERSNLRADAEANEPMPPSDDEPVPATEPEAETPIDTEEEPETPVEAPIVEAAPEFNPDQEYELVVDGKPIKVKGSQILERGRASIQKEVAADYKLEVATALLNEAKALHVSQEAPPAEAAVLTPEQLAQIVQFGTQEQAAEAIKYIMEKAAAPQKETVALTKQLPQIVNDQLAFKEATDFVQSEYKDLMADPDLRSLFFMKENGMRDAGDKRPYKEVYKAIGDELRTKFNRQVPATAKTMEQKLEAKKSTPSVPRLASTRMETPAEKKPPTTQEVIDKMRASRGQRPHATIN